MLQKIISLDITYSFRDMSKHTKQLTIQQHYQLARFSNCWLPFKNSRIVFKDSHIQPHIINTLPRWQDENLDCQTSMNTQGSSSINSHKQGGTIRAVKVL